MNDREELIEEAAKAMRAARLSFNVDGPRWTWTDLTRAAFAVFEKAHAPTDDEREARRVVQEVLDEPLTQGIPSEVKAAQIVMALRRSEMSEPSADHLMQAPAIQAVRDVLDYYADEIDTHIWQEIASLVDDIPDCESATAMPHEEHSEPQGEPSDVQVHAALSAYWGAMNVDEYGSVEGMRAALRAAGGVR